MDSEYSRHIQSRYSKTGKGISGYLGIMLSKSDANNTTKGVVSSIAASLAGFVGYKAFYKPIKIDISGKTYD